MDDPLLLHSLSEHAELIFACLEAASSRRIVEIGSETGGFTKQLADWAGAHDGTLVSIEPFPTGEIRHLAADLPHFELHEGRSPAALTEIQRGDAYIVDGDHNYWTVSRELEAIFDPGGAGASPLAVLHDVGWPCARRDQYYEPSALPPDALHAYSRDKGRVPGRSELIEGGFRGSGQFAVAVVEGGPRNGVLTAVEDFLRGHDELAYYEVPVVFGVGFVFAKAAPYAEQIEALLAPWHGSALARSLENNRLRLFAEVLALQDAPMRYRLRHNQTLLEYEDRLAACQAEIAALRLERAQLRARAVRALDG